MKKFQVLKLTMLVGVLFANATIMKAQDLDNFSYSLGMIIAQNLQPQGIEELNTERLAKAIDDVLSGRDTEMSLQEAQSVYGTHMQALKSKKFAAAKAEGEAFLAQNGARPEVKTTASGLQYEVLTQGAGEKPSATSKVNVHYHGTLINGEVFDSSVDRGQPISFGLNQVIKGWTEGLQLMPVGSKYRLFIPYDLAYGERGSGGKIPPFSALIFDVELLGIE